MHRDILSTRPEGMHRDKSIHRDIISVKGSEECIGIEVSPGILFQGIEVCKRLLCMPRDRVDSSSNLSRLSVHFQSIWHQTC